MIAVEKEVTAAKNAFSLANFTDIPSVCLSHARIVSKWLNTESRKQCHTTRCYYGGIYRRKRFTQTNKFETNQ